MPGLVGAGGGGGVPGLAWWQSPATRGWQGGIVCRAVGRGGVSHSRLAWVFRVATVKDLRNQFIDFILGNIYCMSTTEKDIAVSSLR